ncbi:MAG: uroporphyrinogen decarboxylase [Alphaproteobacteria bacterium]|nr:uroporphyrinogen decarboxylase [Alphaproteobacteria bacterium]
MPAIERRLLRALRRQPVDRVPFWFMRQAGRYLPEYRRVREQAGSFLALCQDPARAAEVTLQPVRRFQPDAAIIFADILLLPHALGQALAFREAEGPVLEPIRDEGTLARLRPEGAVDRLAAVYEALQRTREALPSEVALIGFAGSPWTVASYMVAGRGGDEQVAAKRWAYAVPEGFARLIEILVEATADYLIRQVGAGADVLQLFDSWAGGLPEPVFRRFVIAPTAAIVARVRAACAAVPIIGFARGAGVQLAAYAAETGIDGVGLDTGIAPSWAAEILQPRFVVQGNLDPQFAVLGSTAMLAAAESILRTLANGPLIFNLGHGIVPETPPENIAQLADCVRRFRARA